MIDPLSNNNKPRINWMLVILAGIAVISLSLCMALFAFAIGRQTATPEVVTETVIETVVETVTVVEQVEVTREIVVEVTAVPLPPDTAQPEQPTPLPTAVPPDPIPERVDVEQLDFAVFYEAWQLIERDFDGELPPEDDLLYATILGSLDALDDRFTRFITPNVAQRMRDDMDGSVSGIGAYVRENDDGFFEITAPIEGQPAQAAGLLPGDLIVAVDGETVVGLDFEEVILMVRGPEGTAVTLTIVREGEPEPLEFTIIRATFEVPIVEADILGDANAPIAYVRLVEFNRNAAEKMLEALDELLAQNPQGLIFDLRNDGGGFLDQAIAVGDIFLPEGVLLYERNRQGLDQVFRTFDGGVAETIPLVVLVNAGSASASEIVAGAIQDRERGILIGETTLGKGSVQTLHRLSDGSELRVTIAHWYTPNNNSIDGQGITPDIEIPSFTTDPDSGRRTFFSFGSQDDIQLQRAVEYLMTGE